MAFQPPQQQDNIIKSYATVILVVAFIAVLWVIFNEVVMGLGDASLDIVASGPGRGIIGFVITIYRIVPIGMIIGVFIWCFLRAVKKEPYQQYG